MRRPSDAECARDLGKRTVRRLVLLDRGAGGDAESRIFGEHGDELVGHSVGEVLLRRIAGEIIEGENRNGSDGGLWVAMQQSIGEWVGAEGERQKNKRERGYEGECDVAPAARGTCRLRGRREGEQNGLGGC